MKLPIAKGAKRALLVEGGGMKGAFAGGVLHGMNGLLNATNFDLVVGVSSGACSAAYYVTMPKPEPVKSEKALSVWYSELSGRQLISVFHPFQGKTFLDQEYLIDYIFRNKVRLESENLEKDGLPEFRIAVSNLHSHTVDYVRATATNVFDLLKAATSLPIATRGKHKLDGTTYSDAAILNPLPLQDLIEAGYKSITVVMNSPIARISEPLGFIIGLLAFPRNWKLSKMMREWHHHHFNDARRIALEPPKGVQIHTIAPDDSLPVGLVTTVRKRLRETVELGVKKGEEASQFLLNLFSLNKKKSKGTVKPVKILTSQKSLTLKKVIKKKTKPKKSAPSTRK
ncbi:patatin-like phospholipase family protein [Leptospira ilyithenensis]|uniref:Hydrolase n=1 Tax=Leptospira ilyithenensis TaxID=2484901 RepID=A0A4V3JWT9_9LEPT|nr:patatin-like phospholipase family protein [Leptospira ilyithenensis]TGN06939.1 hydrolase [Leptospira ilyithenensis]